MGGILRLQIINRLPYSLVLLGVMLVAIWGFRLVAESSGGAVGPNVGNLGGYSDGSIQAPNATDRQIERFQARLEVWPNDPSAYVQLGNSYIQKGRETGQVSQYSRAENVLSIALKLDSANSGAMTSLGFLALERHQFAEAIDWATRSLDSNPINADALGVLGSAQLEIGQYEAGMDNFQAMVDLKPNLAAYANVAYARKLIGDVDGAIEAMALALGAGPSGSEHAAWANNQLGNLYFDAGRISEAQMSYEAALDEFSGSHQALAGLGKVRAAQGSYDEAIVLFEKSIAIYPQPTTLAALGDLLVESGKSAEAQLQFDTVELIAELAARNRQIYNRQLAMFYANHDLNLDESLRLTASELESRKDIYGYDALAWALYKNGRLSEATEAITEAMKLGTQDAALYYHSGMIHLGLGNLAEAQDHLEYSLRLNPHFSVLQANIARAALSELTEHRATSQNATGAAK